MSFIIALRSGIILENVSALKYKAEWKQYAITASLSYNVYVMYMQRWLKMNKISIKWF